MLRCTLWIALKSWYLWYSEQRITGIHGRAKCCELLSKVDIFDIRNNRFGVRLATLLVVNCSQKLISLIFGTTVGIRTTRCHRLWIALKSWYLWYSEQQFGSWVNGNIGCELLSKVDIFDIRNNLWSLQTQKFTVVNCSQKLISLIFGTTKRNNLCVWMSCELLSKVDIFDIRNNVEFWNTLVYSVVNCSQKLISLIFGTTP